MADNKHGTATRVLLSMVFIALGLGFAIDAAISLFDGDFGAMLGLNSMLGLLMFVLGIMGISKSSMKACRAMAIIVCILSLVSFVLTVRTFEVEDILGGITSTFVWSLLAWIYFDVA